MRIACRLALLAAVVPAALIGISLQAQSPGARAVPGQLIVKYRDQSAPAERVRARSAAGARLVANLERPGAMRSARASELLSVAAGAATDAIAERLRRDPAVEYVEPNWIYTHAALPDDPSFPQQWALRNTGQLVLGSGGTAGADIDALTAWSAVTLSSSAPVYVGVIDEGIDYRHPDLGAQPGGPVWTNPFDPVDGIDNDGNGYPDDVHGWDFAYGDSTIYDGTSTDTGIDSHGTHVAGIIAARRGNGAGVAGTASGVVIIPAKFLAPGGGTTAGAVMALDYLTDLKVRHGLNIVAVNNSWTGGAYSQALLDAIGRAAREEILFIPASGNGGADEVGDNNDQVASYPSGYDSTAAAGYDAVLAVTATGSSDQLMAWGNYGYRSVDLGAPGALIISTTPQQGYGYSSGTSMATPHVTAGAALVHARRGVVGHALKEVLLGSVDPVPSLAGRTATGGRLNLARAVGASGTSASDPSAMAEIVLYAAGAAKVAGNWKVVADSSAAGGKRMQSADLGAAKLLTPLANPTSYFELTFFAEAGRPYHLWMRGRAENNSWANDSVHVQFDGTVRSGSPAYRIGTTAGLTVNLENCGGCGISGWGWQDTAYGAGVGAAPLYFASTGVQRIRVQTREDGFGIDQIVLSSRTFLTASPGALKNDATILTKTGTSTAGQTDGAIREIVLYAANAAVVRGQWTRTADAAAAGGARLQSTNAGAPRIVSALASPTHYFELSFRADKGTAYRVWIRGKALSNSWANDSVHVQFNDSLTAAGSGVYRIGTTSATAVNIEDCSGCGLSGWGWQDNGWGVGVRGPEIRFAATGTHTIRVQVREDGIGIDQIVLSAGAYLTASPGALKNDTKILPRTQ